jgi:hypothetical protein
MHSHSPVVTRTYTVHSRDELRQKHDVELKNWVPNYIIMATSDLDARMLRPAPQNGTGAGADRSAPSQRAESARTRNKEKWHEAHMAQSTQLSNASSHAPGVCV